MKILASDNQRSEEKYVMHLKWAEQRIYISEDTGAELLVCY